MRLFVLNAELNVQCSTFMKQVRGWVGNVSFTFHRVCVLGSLLKMTISTEVTNNTFPLWKLQYAYRHHKKA